MLIKMINGNYGFDDNGNIRVKTPSDPPFNVPDSEAERLVSLRFAVYAGESAKVPSKSAAAQISPAADIKPAAPVGDNVKPATPVGDIEDDVTEDDIDDSFPEFDENSTLSDLQAIAKEYGVELPRRATKEMALKALNEFFSDSPDLSAEEPQ